MQEEKVKIHLDQGLVTIIYDFSLIRHFIQGKKIAETLKRHSSLYQVSHR